MYAHIWDEDRKINAQKFESSFYSFLLVAGYLKAEETGITPAGDLMCKVSLPNKEILSKLEHIVPQALTISIQEAIFDNDAKRVKTLQEKLLRESVSFYDTAKEIFYHGLALGLCAVFSDSYNILKRNSKSGVKRLASDFFPAVEGKTGIEYNNKGEA